MRDITDPTRTILIIEDDRFFQRAAGACLRARGFRILTASDGTEGLRLARSESPDLILLDIMLPTITGLEVLRALRADERTGTLPVCIVSSTISDDDLRQAVDLGITGQVPKAAVSLGELCDHVTRVIEGGSSRAPSGAA